MSLEEKIEKYEDLVSDIYEDVEYHSNYSGYGRDELGAAFLDLKKFIKRHLDMMKEDA